MPCPSLADVFSRALSSARDELEAVYAEKGVVLALRLDPILPPLPGFCEKVSLIASLAAEGRVGEAYGELVELYRRARASRIVWFMLFLLLSLLALVPVLHLGVYPLLAYTVFLGFTSGFIATWTPLCCLYGLGGEEVRYSPPSGEREL